MSRWIHFGLLFCLLFGCGDSTSDDLSDDGSGEVKYRIAVIPKGTTHEFWKSVHFGAQLAADELGDVEIIWDGPIKESDTSGQTNIVQNFISKKVDGIVLAPNDSQALVEYVAEANEYKIPVVIFDSGLDEGAEYVNYVATDNFKGGELAAQQMGKLLGGEGDVILFRYKAGSESTEQREEGFLTTLRKEYPNITVLVDNQYIGTTPEDSKTNATNILQTHQDRVDGVFAVCEPNATGTLGALEELGLEGKVICIAFDPSPELVAAMETDPPRIHGIVLQDPVAMGYEAVMSLYKHLEGESVKKRIDTGEYLATPENMNEKEMKTLLNPPQFD